MTDGRAVPLATEPAFAVADAVEAVILSRYLVSELQLEGLDRSQRLGVHVMLLNLELSIAELLTVSAEKASEVARDLWGTSYEQLEHRDV